MVMSRGDTIVKDEIDIKTLKVDKDPLIWSFTLPKKHVNAEHWIMYDHKADPVSRHESTIRSWLGWEGA